MGDVVHLATKQVLRQVSQPCVERLQALLMDAEAGRIKGFAYVALTSNAGPEIDATGTALLTPGVVRVALRDLDDKLALITR
jgi:hypothetical protein